jgi:hypothetical protein
MLFAFVLTPVVGTAAEAAIRPNILVITVDDMGEQKDDNRFSNWGKRGSRIAQGPASNTFSPKAAFDSM